MGLYYVDDSGNFYRFVGFIKFVLYCSVLEGCGCAVNFRGICCAVNFRGILGLMLGLVWGRYVLGVDVGLECLRCGLLLFRLLWVYNTIATVNSIVVNDILGYIMSVGIF